jgi:hypothetical protein
MTVDYDIDFGSIAIGPPASRTDPAAPMFAAVEGRVASLSNNECVFQPRDGGGLHVMTHQVLQALDQCREFRSLDEHIARVVGVVPGLAGQGEAVRRVLSGLAERGLLRTDADFLADLARPVALAPAPFRAVVVRACDRPTQAQALLASLAEHGQRFDRRDPLLLVDDSRSPEAVRAHQALVEAHGRAGGPARYVGREQVADLSERLAKARPESRAAIASLLGARADAGFGGGRGYNLALLLTAGGRLALLDDDYLLPFHRATTATSGLEPNPWTPFPVRFHADGSRALAAGQPLEQDGLALQQDLVGQSLGGVLAGHSEMALSRELLRGQSLGRLAHLRSDARILATYTGSRGASFTSDSGWLYDIDPASRAGFWLDRASYLRNVHADAVEYAPERMLPRPFGMFTPFLLDNGQLLPCTAPTGRGEDALFGVVGSYMYPDSLALHLPITIGHRQEGQRPRYARARQPLTPGINRFLREWVRNQAQPAQSADPGERLALLAAQLEDIAGSPAANRIGLLEEYVRYVRADLVERLQQQLLAAPDAPVYWAADVREVVETNGRALLADDPPRLDEWPADIDAAGCAQRLREACLELAAGYRHWPGLWQTAAELGERLLPGR